MNVIEIVSVSYVNNNNDIYFVWKSQCLTYRNADMKIPTFDLNVWTEEIGMDKNKI